jgi:hypothetical protein
MPDSTLELFQVDGTAASMNLDLACPLQPMNLTVIFMSDTCRHIPARSVPDRGILCACMLCACVCMQLATTCKPA